MKKKIMIVVTILVMCLTFAACSGGSDENSYVGTWKAVNADMEGLEMSIEELMGGEMTFELKDGGECIVSIMDEEEKSTWTETEDGFNVDEIADFKVDGNTATADIEGMIITLEKQ